jgi:hypothetical protein
MVVEKAITSNPRFFLEKSAGIPTQLGATKNMVSVPRKPPN